MLRQPTISTGMSTKLQRCYRGPMVITAVKPGDIYGVADLNQGQGRLYATMAHVSLIKPFHKHQDEESNSEDETENETEEQETEENKRPMRQRRQPPQLNDYILN